MTLTWLYSWSFCKPVNFVCTVVIAVHLKDLVYWENKKVILLIQLCHYTFTLIRLLKYQEKKICSSRHWKTWNHDSQIEDLTTGIQSGSDPTDTSLTNVHCHAQLQLDCRTSVFYPCTVTFDLILTVSHPLELYLPCFFQGSF